MYDIRRPNPVFLRSGRLLHMDRGLDFLLLVFLRHASIQERRKSNLCLYLGQLFDILLAAVTSERSVHLFESLAFGLWYEEPVECKSQH